MKFFSTAALFFSNIFLRRDSTPSGGYGDRTDSPSPSPRPSLFNNGRRAGQARNGGQSERSFIPKLKSCGRRFTCCFGGSDGGVSDAGSAQGDGDSFIPQHPSVIRPSPRVSSSFSQIFGGFDLPCTPTRSAYGDSLTSSTWSSTLNGTGSNDVDIAWILEESDTDGDSVELTEDARMLTSVVVPKAMDRDEVGDGIGEENGESVSSAGPPSDSLDLNGDLAASLTLLEALQYLDSNEEVVTMEEDEILAPVWCLKFDQ